MSEKGTYRVTVERDGGWWFVNVPDLPGCHTQVRRLDQVEDAARDVIALWLQTGPSNIAVRIVPILPAEFAGGRVRDAKAYRMLSDFFGFVSSMYARDAASSLLEQGLTIRDIGRILGVSHQRVAQLLRSEPEVPSGRDREIEDRGVELMREFVRASDAGPFSRLARLSRPPLEVLERRASEERAAYEASRRD